MVRFNILLISRRRLLALLFTAIGFAFLIWLLNSVVPVRGFWNAFPTYNDVATYFCETTDMDALVRQPINTFSNFIYWMGALAILRRGWKDQSKRNRYNIISANPFYSITYGIILLYTFCMSTLFHSSLLIFTNRLDFSAVYSLSLFPLMYFSHRLWLLKIGVPTNTRHPRSTRILVASFTTLYVLFTFFMPDGWGRYVVAGIICIIIAFGIYLERKDPGKTNHRYLIICIVSILFAVMWFTFDVYKILCAPESILQPHSLWHLFGGIAAFYFYMYIRSEKNKLQHTTLPTEIVLPSRYESLPR